tara:strand:- start:1532 stop:1945 length:414 start_codon:yes stop_codon:yes gene_type:complete
MGAALSSMISELPSLRDPAVGACQAWLGLEAQYVTLVDAWQMTETHFIRAGYWRDQSDHTSTIIPDPRELQDIGRRLHRLEKRKQQLLLVLPRTPATTARGIELKLDVLAKVINPDEYQTTHDLAVSIRRNLAQPNF